MRETTQRLAKVRIMKYAGFHFMREIVERKLHIRFTSGIVMRTILVAEDRDTSRELVRTLLEHSGYAVLEASNGEEAVRIAHEQHPDLVLLDLQMPLKDGFEVLHELRSDEQFKSTPIVALTASAMMGDKDKALMEGFSAYLTKPLSLSTVRREIARLFDVA